MKYAVGLVCLSALFSVVFGIRKAGGDSAGTRNSAEKSVQQAEHRPQRGWRSVALRVIGMLGAIYVLLAVLLLLFEGRFVYHPKRRPDGDWRPPPGVAECTFVTEDGLQLYAWWRPPEKKDGPVFLWFHGNAGNITHRAENIAALPAEIGFLMVDYRGYGKSQGHPSEQGLYRDGLAAYEYLRGEKGVPPFRIISFGRSLGTAVALHVAVERRTAGVILESPLASARAMARRTLPFIPVWPFMRSRFDNVGTVADLPVPLLVIHGDEDSVVPFGQGRAVWEAATEPKDFYRIEGAGHNDTYRVGGREYFGKLVAFARRCTEEQGGIPQE